MKLKKRITAESNNSYFFGVVAAGDARKAIQNFQDTILERLDLSACYSYEELDIIEEAKTLISEYRDRMEEYEAKQDEEVHTV